MKVPVVKKPLLLNMYDSVVTMEMFAGGENSQVNIIPLV